jgi:transcriptional regulator with XRE-family HTH domain
LEKLDMLMNEKQISRGELAKQSGIPYTTIVGFYDKGYENTKLSTLQKLVDYFDVTLDYLADDEIKKPATKNDDGLDEKEAEWLKLYRQIPDDRKAEYWAMLEAALRSQGLI